MFGFAEMSFPTGREASGHDGLPGRSSAPTALRGTGAKQTSCQRHKGTAGRSGSLPTRKEWRVEELRGLILRERGTACEHSAPWPSARPSWRSPRRCTRSAGCRAHPSRWGCCCSSRGLRAGSRCSPRPRRSLLQAESKQHHQELSRASKHCAQACRSHLCLSRSAPRTRPSRRCRCGSSHCPTSPAASSGAAARAAAARSGGGLSCRSPRASAEGGKRVGRDFKGHRIVESRHGWGGRDLKDQRIMESQHGWV